MSAGPVSKIRLLGDYHHPTRIAFVEFTNAESARAALNCSGAMLGEPHSFVLLTVGRVSCDDMLDTNTACHVYVQLVHVQLLTLLANAVVGLWCKVTSCTPARHAHLFANMLLRSAGSTPVRVSPSKTPVRPDPRHDDTPVPRRSSA